MDSQLIYSASDKIKSKIIWNRITPDSEWIHFGTNEEIDKRLILNTIDSHLMGDNLYFVFTRKESKKTNKEDIDAVISDFIGVESFLIWDFDFKKAIEFNRIGTMRCGQLFA